MPGKGKWVEAQPLREDSVVPGVPGARIGEWPEPRWDHQCIVYSDPRLEPTEDEPGRKVNRTNTTVQGAQPGSFTLFVMGGQRPGKQPFFGSDYGGGGDAWNLTVINIHADVPVVRWSRVNISLHGNGWTPRYGHCAMHMRVRGFWQRTLSKAYIQSPDDGFEAQVARAADSQSELDRIREAIKDQQVLGEHHPSATTDVTMVLGGLTKYGFRGDVWLSTSRGLMWERRHHRAFSGRYFHGCAPLGGHSIIVMGGRSSSSDSSLSDVHRSDDFGLSWTRITTRAGWSNRYRFGTAVFVASNIATASAAASAGEGLGGTKSLSLGASPHIVMIFGGYSSGNSVFYADSWATNDGIHWTKQMWDAPLLSKWDGRSGHGCVTIPGTAKIIERGAHTKWTMGAEAQIRQAPTIIMVAGRDKGERLSDVWVRQGPVVLTNSATDRYLSFTLQLATSIALIVLSVSV